MINWKCLTGLILLFAQVNSQDPSQGFAGNFGSQQTSPLFTTVYLPDPLRMNNNQPLQTTSNYQNYYYRQQQNAAINRFYPKFDSRYDPNAPYYQQTYDYYQNEINKFHDSQKQWMSQMPEYNMQQNYRQQLATLNNAHMDENGNVYMGDPNWGWFLSCNGKGCNSRG